jgi:cytoskeletal protein CcmA (bactofilin family)
MGTGLISGQVYEKKTDELYAADAGVEDVIWRIQTNNLTFDGNHSGPCYLTVNGKNVSVEVYEIDRDPTPCGTNFTYQILSTAVTDDGGGTAAIGSSTTIESYVTMTRPTTVVPFRFDNAITSDTTLFSSMASWVTSYPTPLNGDIVAGGKFTVSGTIYGDVTVPTAGDLTTTKGILGNIIYAPYSPPATPDISPYKTQAMAAENATLTPASNYNNGGTIDDDTRLSGSLTLASNKALTVNGDLYIDGYVTLASGSTLIVNGALYVGGYVNANATSKLSFGGTAYVKGYMTLGKNNISEVSYVIIAEGNITFGALDNGKYDLIDRIYDAGKDSNGVPKGLTADESAYITGPHSIIMSEGGDITTKDQDYVEIGGFLYAPLGQITTYHFFRLIGAMFGHSVIIKDIRQIYAGTIPGGSSDSGDSPGGVTILSWDVQ